MVTVNFSNTILETAFMYIMLCTIEYYCRIAMLFVDCVVDFNHLTSTSS